MPENRSRNCARCGQFYSTPSMWTKVCRECINDLLREDPSLNPDLASCPEHFLHNPACHPCRGAATDSILASVSILQTNTAAPTPEPQPTPQICGHCDEQIGETETLVRIKVGDRSEPWHESCAEENAAQCDLCHGMRPLDDLCGAPNDSDDRLCQSCWDDHCGNCEDCGDSYWNDDLYYSENLGKAVCTNCRDQYNFCNYCEDYYCDSDEGTHIKGRRHSYYYCENCAESLMEEGQLVRCSISDHFIDLTERGTYILDSDGTTKISYAYVRDALEDESTAPERKIRFQNLLDIDNVRIESEEPADLADLENTLHSSASRNSAENIASLIVNRQQQELYSARQRPVGQDHDPLYMGMEFELIDSGKNSFFKVNRVISKFNGKMATLLEGPHKSLAKELKGFKMTNDGSIAPHGYEFLTPIVKRLRDWEAMEKAVKTFQDFEWKTNESCGLHFHFSQKNLTPDNPKIIRDIFRIFYYIEPLIFACLPPDRRDNQYCKAIKRFFTQEEIEKNTKLDYWYYSAFWKQRALRPMNPNGPHGFNVIPIIHRLPFSQREIVTQNGYGCEFGNHEFNYQIMNASKEEHYYPGRYIGCNLHALFTKGTLEFRYFPMVLDFKYIFHWGNILKYILRYALENKPLDPIVELAKSHRNPKTMLAKVSKIFGLTANQQTFLQSEFNKWRKTDIDREKVKTPDNQRNTFPFTLDYGPFSSPLLNFPG